MIIYKAYDQAALDGQYNNRLHVPDHAAYRDRWAAQSQETREKLPVAEDISYGPMPREKLDVYPALEPLSKTLVFIHGGYWHLLDKAMFHFIAAGFRPYGITTVFLNYPLAPQASIDDIVGSCRRAVQWLYQHVQQFQGNPHQMYVAGHSAGGHLAAMLMATNWQLFDPAMPANLLRGGCFISGIFNLVPIRLSILNSVLKLNGEMALRNSPVQLEPVNKCPLVVAVGREETREFNDQSKELYASWKARGCDMQLLPLPGLHHFSIVDAVADPTHTLHQAICHLMGIKENRY